MEYLIPNNYYRDDLDNREVMVSIHCIAYNQGKYIKETLDGFIAQKTNFRFEAIVHDDASTDNTADIIKEYAEKYPSIIKPIFETENQYSKRDGSLSKIMFNHLRGKYIAYCEGDDYWIDPLKLQKQVDFLETHPDYTLVCCNKDEYIQSENKIRVCYKETGTFNINRLIIDNVVTTCSTMIRKDLLLKYYEEIPPKLLNLSFGDYQLWLYMSARGSCMKLKDTMCVYRVCSSGVTKFKNNEQKLDWMHSVLPVIDYYCSNYTIEDDAKHRGYFHVFRQWSYTAAKIKDNYTYKRALKFYFKNKYFGTVLLLLCARWIRYPMYLWAGLNIHNNIKPKAKKTYTLY